MRSKTKKIIIDKEDPLLPQVIEYLNKFDFPLAYIIQKKFKIGFTRAEKILTQIQNIKITIT